MAGNATIVRALVICLLAACLAFGETNRAQQTAPAAQGATPGKENPAGGETLSFSAVDHDGGPVVGLQAEDLALQIDNAPRKIVSLLPTNAQPRIIGVFFDVSADRRGDRVVGEEAEATANFLNSVWHRGDGGFVVVFSDGPLTLAKPTTDLQPIQAALQKIPRWDVQGGTAVYDALCSIRFGPKVGGREKVFVVVTNFEDTSSHNSLEKMIQTMREEGVRVVVVLRPWEPAEDDQHPAFGLRQEKVMQHFAEHAAEKAAKETGGSVFVVTSQKELDAAFQRLAGELQGAYRLTYEPLPSTEKPKKLELTTTRRDVVLHYAKN